MGPLLSSLPGPPPSVAGDYRLLCHFVEPLPSLLLLADGRSAVGGHGCDDAAVGWSSGLCFPYLRPSPVCHREGLAVSGVGAHVGSSVLASTPLVSGASGGCPCVPSTSEGSTQTASFPSFPPEPPRALSDCVSYIERSARTFGFSSAVARQLARCRRSSTRMNYQVRWAVYYALCARRGHSVSRPTVPKVAFFVLYLHRSFSLAIRLLPTGLCSVLSFTLFSLSFLSTLFFVISSTPIWSILFTLLVFLLGIFLFCSFSCALFSAGSSL